jgi:hypothetical protein
MSQMRTRRFGRKGGVTAVLLVTGSAVLALGIAAPFAGARVKAAKPKKLTTLTVGSPTAFAQDVVAYAAMGLGLFKKAGLSVQFQYDPTPQDLLVSGAAQLMSDQPAHALGLIGLGQNVKIIAANTVNVYPGLIGSVASLAALQSEGTNCTIAEGTSGVLYEYTNGWMKKYGIKCNVVTIASSPVVQAGVEAGTYAAAAEVPPIGDGMIAATSRKLHWIIDPTSSSFVAKGYNLGYEYINDSYYTNRHDLTTDKAAITKFFEVETKAIPVIEKMSPKAVATAVRKSGVAAWNAESLAEVEASLTGFGVAPKPENAILYNNISLGPIKSSLWSKERQAIQGQNSGVNAYDGFYSYSNAINNTLINTALSAS